MTELRSWLVHRRALAREHWRIRAVEYDARRLVEELERRRNGLPPERIAVPDLRAALNEVSDPNDLVPVRPTRP